MSIFITFEGGEGSGKSTQVKSLHKRLLKEGISVVLTQEPGGTSLGKEVRRFLKKTKGTEISPLAELFLFNASRAQLVEKIIRPSLEIGDIVICDRFTDSTVAYQGYGRGLDLDSTNTVNNAATGGLLPDLVIFLDIPVEIGLSRKGTERGARFEREEISFHQRVREGYLKLAAASPERWLVVDAQLPRKEIGKIIWERVSKLINQKT